MSPNSGPPLRSVPANVLPHSLCPHYHYSGKYTNIHIKTEKILKHLLYQHMHTQINGFNYIFSSCISTYFASIALVKDHDGAAEDQDDQVAALGVAEAAAAPAAPTRVTRAAA